MAGMVIVHNQEGMFANPEILKYATYGIDIVAWKDPKEFLFVPLRLMMLVRDLGSIRAHPAHNYVQASSSVVLLAPRVGPCWWEGV